METIELDQNGNCITDLSAEQLISLDSSDACGVFGDPEVLPRVGNQYQADIPADGPDYVCYMKSPTDAENRDRVCEFMLGLPIPIMLINKETEKMKDEKLEFSSDSTDASNKNAPSDFESVRETMAPFRGSENCLVPGSCGDSWSDIEKSSFLLGLYIFDKNFVQLKTFVENKQMGDIQSFYYGKFYRSNKYSRWATCRKMRSKKCVYGQRIFSGLRQQELLSRLVLHVSEECQKALLEVSKTFGEGKMSLEEYVSSLKVMVGMNILVEAVGIGKGKQDLTGMAIEPVKSNNATHMRPVPIGKACSSLTPTEIVKFLTGGYRLSKARSNDLFWEAVWPRLLARGWHSEQPKNQAYIPGAKHSLVFLMPGVKKFSRRRLEKGNHYFDSITDVLSKVGSEPGLLELDTEEDEGKKTEENGWINEIKEQEDLPERQRHCYLQPRTPSRITDVIKFTVVDTSMTDGKIFKFRELRTLPMEISKKLSTSEDSDQGTSEVSTNESDCAYTMLVDQVEANYTTHTKTLSDRGMTFDRKDLNMSSSDQGVQINGPDSTKSVKKFEKQNNLGKDKQAKKAEQDDLDCLALVTKRKRALTACTNEEMSSSMRTVPLVPRFGEEVHGCCSDSHNPNNRALSQVGSSQDRLSSTSSSKGSPPDNIVGASDYGYHGPEHPQDDLQSRTLIDLNLPQLPIDFENGVFTTDSTNKQDDMISKQHDDLYAQKTSVDMTTSEQQTMMNSRRQSTRNRPPTARALEALVNGYLTTNRRRKKESDGHETLTSRPPRRARVYVGLSELTTNDAVMAREGGTSVSDDSKSDMFDKLQVLSNGNGTQISNP